MVGKFSTSMVISIHALREEGDQRAAAGRHRKQQNFYPRPPRGGRQSRLIYRNLL